MGGWQRTLIFQKKNKKLCFLTVLGKGTRRDHLLFGSLLTSSTGRLVGVPRPEKTEYRMRSGKTLSFTLGRCQAQERGRSSDDCC